MTAVLIMAGGRSSRMRASGGAPHKALVPVLGVPMLERNIAWLLAGGFTDLHVAVAAEEATLLDFVHRCAQPLAAAFGARLSLLVEPSQLGTLGACRLCAADGDLVVLNVDNLTSLDLHALIDTHRRHAAALTIASHVETFRMPFGQLVLDGDRVARLLEKPETPYQISSGIYVLADRAREAIEPGTRVGPPELFEVLAHAGLVTAAHHHRSPWIDVNDGAALARAEALVARHRVELDCPWPAPDDQRLVLASVASGALRINRDDLPGPDLDRAAAAKAPVWPGADFIASFDEVRPSGRVTRCHLYEAGPGGDRGDDGFVPLARDDTLRGSRVAERCRAYLRLRSGQGAMR